MICFKRSLVFLSVLLIALFFFTFSFSINTLKADDIGDENVSEFAENYKFTNVAIDVNDMDDLNANIEDLKINVEEKTVVSSITREEIVNIDSVYFDKINKEDINKEDININSNVQLYNINKIDKINRNNISTPTEILKKKEINFKEYSGIEDTVVTLLKGDYKVQCGYNKCEQSKKEVLDKEILYRDIFKGIDLIYNIIDNENNLKENIIIKQSSTISSFNLQCILNNLIPIQVDKKTIELINLENQLVYQITTPKMIDANQVESDLVFITIIEQKDNKFIAKINCDEDWLKDKDRKYPIIIDPNYKDECLSGRLNVFGNFYTSLRSKETDSSIYVQIINSDNNSIQVAIFGRGPNGDRNCGYKREVINLQEPGKFDVYNSVKEKGYNNTYLEFRGAPGQYIQFCWSPDYAYDYQCITIGKIDCKDKVYFNVPSSFITDWYDKYTDESVYINVKNTGYQYGTPIKVQVLGRGCSSNSDGNKSFFKVYIDAYTIYAGEHYELYNHINEDGCSQVALRIEGNGNIINEIRFSPDFCPDSTVELAGVYEAVKYANSPQGINVLFIAQKGSGYPTGCEAISATMLLDYYNYKITLSGFVNILPTGGVAGSSNPDSVFIGHPSNHYSYGCFSTPIANTMNTIMNYKKHMAKALVNMPLDELAQTYIVNKKQPILIWATIGMKASYPGTYWHNPINFKYYWPAEEHCVVLTGVDEGYYYFNDPLAGIVRYPKNIVTDRYNEMGRHAVIVLPIEIKKEVQKQRIQQPKNSCLILQVLHVKNSQVIFDRSMQFESNSNFKLIYNRQLAFEYSQKYCEKGNNNPVYFNFEKIFNGNCANFVSQCLKAGGYQENTEWFYNKKYKNEGFVNSVIDFLLSKVAIIYSNNKKEAIASPAWAAAKNHYEYWKTKTKSNVIEIKNTEKLSEILKQARDNRYPIQIGDLLYFAFSKTGEVHHATFISNVDNNKIYYAANTNNACMKELCIKIYKDNNKDDSTDKVFIVRLN